MILYNKTFDNIKTIGFNFPIEDAYFCKGNFAVVADGITRDFTGYKNTRGVSPLELATHYPNPSGAEYASKEICKSFENDYNKIINNELSLKGAFINANKKVKELNDKYIKECDYLENDYYGAVASAAYIHNNVLYYSYVCDCGIAVFNNKGELKFKTNDDMASVDSHFDTSPYEWYDPEARVIVRRDYRNKPNNKYSYGALTGEKEFENFIREGSINLEKDDLVIVYSDGFSSYLVEKDFYKNFTILNKEEFEDYINKMSKTDYEKYGREKTVIIIENK